MTNRKSHKPFKMTWKSSSADDLEGSKRTARRWSWYIESILAISYRIDIVKKNIEISIYRYRFDIVSILGKRRRCCLFISFSVDNKSINLCVFTFYAPQLYRQVLLRRVLATGILSVRPSVRLSVTTRWYTTPRWDRDSESSPYDNL